MKKFFLFLKASSWAAYLVIAIITIIVVACSIAVCGRNNAIENLAEEIVEHELNLPTGSIDKALDEIEACQIQDGDMPK